MVRVVRRLAGALARHTGHITSLEPPPGTTTTHQCPPPGTFTTHHCYLLQVFLQHITATFSGPRGEKNHPVLVLRMVSQSAHNLPKTTVLCGSTWMHPATQGPSLHRVWHAVKALHPASATSSRSTTATTAAQEPVSSPGPPTVMGAGNWLDAKLPAPSRTASARCQDSQRCQSSMPAPGSCQPRDSSNTIPPGHAASLQGRPCVPPVCYSQLDNKRRGQLKQAFRVW